MLDKADTSIWNRLPMYLWMCILDRQNKKFGWSKSILEVKEVENQCYKSSMSLTQSLSSSACFSVRTIGSVEISVYRVVQCRIVLVFVMAWFFNLLKTHRTTILLLSTSMVLSFLVYFIWESQKICSLKRVFGT